MKHKKILFIDACPRKESRTRELARFLLEKLEGEVEVLPLYEETFPDLDDAAVCKRGLDCAAGDYSAPVYDYAKQFAAADCIVIAAPFWDLSFPACLKKYIETITVTGLTFRYSDEGFPIGLCKAEDLYYVSTAGGPVFNDAYGYGYVEMMAKGMYGIQCCHKYFAENLDIVGNDAEAILEEAKKKIQEELSSES